MILEINKHRKKKEERSMLLRTSLHHWQANYQKESSQEKLLQRP